MGFSPRREGRYRYFFVRLAWFSKSSSRRVQIGRANENQAVMQGGRKDELFFRWLSHVILDVRVFTAPFEICKVQATSRFLSVLRCIQFDPLHTNLYCVSLIMLSVCCLRLNLVVIVTSSGRKLRAVAGVIKMRIRRTGHRLYCLSM